MNIFVRNHRGITLIELLIAMAVTGVIATAVFAIYFSQNRTYMVQEQVVDTQQGLRVAMKLLARELRMAGLNDPFNPSGAGFNAATATTLTFTLDRTGGETDGIDNDGDGAVDEADESNYPDGDTSDADENITYVFSAGNLVRNNGALAKVMVSNVDAAEFNYHLADGSQTTTPAAHQLDDIRSVEVTLLARTEREDGTFSANSTYTLPSGATVTTGGDGYRRRLLSTTVRCRNMGL